MRFKLVSSTFRGPIGKLALGSIGGYAIVLALSPIMTRLYTPKEFGQFAIFSSFVAIASVCMSLSLELGVLSSRRRSEALRFVILAATAVTTTSLIMSVALFVLREFEVNLPLPAWAIALAILSCAAASITSVAINWSIYTEETRLASRAVVASLSGRNIMQVILGYLYGGLWGIVAGEVAGRLLALFIAVGSRRIPIRKIKLNNKRIFKGDLKAIRPYALYITPATAIDTALIWLPAPLFTVLYGPFAGGLIAMTQRFGSVPLTIANQSLGQIFHRKTAEKLGVDNRYILRFLYYFLVVLLLPTTLAVLFLFWRGDTLFKFLLGEAWSQTYVAAIALSPLYFFQFISLLTNRIILVSGRANIKLISSLVQLCVLLSSVGFTKWISIPWESALFCVGGCLALTQLISILYVLRLLTDKKNESRVAQGG